MHKKQTAILKVLISLTAGAVVGIFVFQAEVALQPGGPLTFELTRRIVYGYHKGDSTDHCGNGTVDTGQNETCDGTGSVATCRLSTAGVACTNECCTSCGDGFVDNSGGGETCDDGNTTSGDGCSSSCAVESGYSCNSEPSSCSTSCGDGVVAGTEECDDGNTSNHDACAQCQNAECGDGYVRTGVEECDDGNSSNTDSCTTSCKQGLCGDGIKQSTEECDYAITGQSECNTQCRTVRSVGKGGTDGETLPPPRRTGPPLPCGNGIVEKEKGEECDNGRFNGVTDCSEECKHFICGDGIISSHLSEECEVEFEEEVTEAGTRYWYTSPSCGISCTLPECIGDRCSGGCEREVLPACEGDPTLRRSRAPAPVEKTETGPRPGQRPSPPANCGNGVHEPNLGEECDLGAYNAVSGCSLWCEVLYCGDRAVSTPIGEECEPEQDDSGAFVVRTCGTSCTVPVCDAKGGCSGGCRIRFLDPCLPGEEGRKTSMQLSLELFSEEEPAIEPSAPTTRQEPVCGNDRIEEGEGCDDGNVADLDGCSSTCTLEEGGRDKCGDGVLEQWEECDNGEFNSDTATNACRTTCRMSHCGDTVIDANEQCDDGNTIDGDECSSQCFKADCGNNVLEIGEGCDNGGLNSDTLPNSCRSGCRMPVCGDSIVDTALGERCDEGELNSDTNPNHCRMDCWPPSCGDGVPDRGEQCDDGNRVDVDTCQNDCTLPVCGDGLRQGNEECDDGNRASGDGCSMRCAREVRIDPTVFGAGLIVFFVGALIEWFIRKRTLGF